MKNLATIIILYEKWLKKNYETVFFAFVWIAIVNKADCLLSPLLWHPNNFNNFISVKKRKKIDYALMLQNHQDVELWFKCHKKWMVGSVPLSAIQSIHQNDEKEETIMF